VLTTASTSAVQLEAGGKDHLLKKYNQFYFLGNQSLKTQIIQYLLVIIALIDMKAQISNYGDKTSFHN
jgi:hypothetical protein